VGKGFTGRRRNRTFRVQTTLNYGQSEKETTSQDVEAQTPEAPQGEPPQEAHVAEVISVT
jgi:hypothetical protein